MRAFPTPKTSLVAKLVLAFILASVPSMMLAGHIVGTLVGTSSAMNVERWLREVTGYLFVVGEELEERLESVYTLEAQRFAEVLPRFSAEDLRAFGALGLDYFTLADERGERLFSSPQGYVISAAPLFSGGPFHTVRLPGENENSLAIVVRRSLVAHDGAQRFLETGGIFSIDLFDNKSEPIELRILLPEGEGFRQVYTSSPEVDFVLPEEAAAAIASGANEVFIPDADWSGTESRGHFLLTAQRDAQGVTQALVVVSAVVKPPGGWFPSQSLIFGGFFLMGTLLSGGMGYLLAKGLMRPIRLLNEGVRQLSHGKMEHRVPVQGQDEVAELGANFNLMADQLEFARHESTQSARRERSRMLGEIALGFAHEIRNPLVVIKTSAELVRNSLAPDNKEGRLLDFVVEEVGRIDTLLSEFLSFARPAPPALEYFSLAGLVNKILEISAAELQKRGIAWSVSSACSPREGEKEAQVIGDVNQIRQVVLNLVLNAAEAMPEGGRLAVRLYESDDGKTVFLEMEDSGGGISEELASTVHLPFISTKQDGLGLGLATVYAIIEAHGGAVSFASKPQEGTTFTLSLKR